MKSTPPRLICFVSALAGLVAFSGCTSQTSMTVNRYDGTTGKRETVNYSQYYDAGVWVKDGEIGLSVVIDHDKTVIPVLHGIQQSIGALGPGDLDATGKVTVYLWNPTDEKREIALRKFTSRQHTIELKGTVNVLNPRSRTGGEIGSIPIFNYGTEIPVEVQYELDGKAGTVSLILARRTHEDLKRYFGPGGLAPYPWSTRNPN